MMFNGTMFLKFGIFALIVVMTMTNHVILFCFLEKYLQYCTYVTMFMEKLKKNTGSALSRTPLRHLNVGNLCEKVSKTLFL